MSVLGEMDVLFTIGESKLLHRVCVADKIHFPGDLLMGMDFLRRLDMKLFTGNKSSKAYLLLGGVNFPIKYTGEDSLGCVSVPSVVEVAKERRATQTLRIAPVHVVQTEFIEPKSGQFVSAAVARGLPESRAILVEGTNPKFIVPRSISAVQGRRTSVWVVNPDAKQRKLTQGTCIGFAEQVGAEQLVDVSAEGNVTGKEPRVKEDTVTHPSSTGHAGRDFSPEAAEFSQPKFTDATTQVHSLAEIDADELAPRSCKVWPADEQVAECPSDTSDDDIELCNFSFDSLDEYYATQDFGYSDEEYFVFPDTPALSGSDACSDDSVLSPNKSGINVVESSDSPSKQVDLGHLDSVQQEELGKVLNKFPRLFSGDKATIGKVPGIQHHIVTKTDQPVCVRQWRLPQATKELIRSECDTMLKQGVIEPSTSPWLSPVVLVRKKDGTVRFCVDYRGLNHVTAADSYPLPRIDEVIDSLTGNVWYTVLDSRAAYWAIEVAEEDRPKTAFTDGARLFQFQRMPFGLSTAPTTFQRTMNVVLSSVLGRHTLAYLDDVVVASKTFESHLNNLAETLALLDEAGMKLNLAKCLFAKHQIEFLGFVVSPDGVLPNPIKVQVINDMKRPRSVREVRRFLGACGFFRRHVQGFASVARPLTQLTKKGVSFTWSPEAEKAFKNLKDALVSAPILRLPDFERHFEIHTDASAQALGAVLLQRSDSGEPQAVSYWSRTLKDAESRYPAIDLEALAVVEAVQVFDPYVYGRPFTIYTDHRPLTYVFSRKTKSPRMSRFAHELSFYDFKLVYKPGPSNYVPDLLSRPFIDSLPCSQDEALAVNENHSVNSDTPVNLATLASAVLREYQLKEDLWKEIIEFLEGKKLPRRALPASLHEFELDDGVLYHLKSLPDRIIRQVCVPHSLQSQALHLAHDHPTAAHPGALRTYHNLQNSYFFPNMFRLCKWYVQHCTACQHRKGSRERAEMQCRPPPSGPLELVSADLMDLRASVGGYRYVLSIVDHHSRYLQLVPLRNKTAETVLRGFYDHFITLFGPPRQIMTDNGGEFANEQWQEVCRQLEIRCSFTIAYHPSSNGLVERTNRVVKDALAMLVADKPGRWPLYLTSVRLAINSAIHRSVGDQPLYLLTGKMALFPRGLTNQVTTDTNLRVQQLAKARQLAIAASLRSREANAQAHNRKVRSTWQPEEGALVLRRDFTGGALQDRWQGPCRVIKQIGPVVFEVKDLQPPYRIVKQHRDQLKMYLPPAELDYVEVGDRLPSDPPGVDGPLPGRPPDVAAPVHVLDDFGYDRTEFSNSGPLNRSPSVYHFLYSGADMSTETNNDYSDYEVWEE